MKKEFTIKKGIIGLVISILLFVISFSFIVNPNLSVLLKENIILLASVIAIAFFNFVIIIVFLICTITQIYYNYYNKKVDKGNLELKQNLKNTIPKEKELKVKMNNYKNEDVNKMLYENLKFTALYDGDTVKINISLPEELTINSDELWFYYNFKKE